MLLIHNSYQMGIVCFIDFTVLFVILSQRIDGFLAVLNISCGSFSPQTQKLPFSVTSIDGDSSLLYYAAIDLANNSPSSKSKSQKLKRSLSIDDSQAVKSRLRIPMKGRIQLVICLLAFHFDWILVRPVLLTSYFI